jgi:hypothetical protein
MTTFNLLNTCSICNNFKLVRRYLGEFLCEECHSELNKFTGNGRTKLVRLREAKGLYGKSE